MRNGASQAGKTAANGSVLGVLPLHSHLVKDVLSIDHRARGLFRAFHVWKGLGGAFKAKGAI